MRAAIVLLACLFAPTALAEPYKIETVATGLRWPWSVAFLPDGDYLVGQKIEGLVRVGRDGSLHPIADTPKNDPALVKHAIPFDVILDKDFPSSRLIFVCRMEGKSVTVTSAKLSGDSLSDLYNLYSDAPTDPNPGHFYGCRLAEYRNAWIFAALGGRERNKSGRIMQLAITGRPVSGIVWSTGARNPQGLVWQGETMFETEHGPKGGDEINIIESGKDYGWPRVGHGYGYDGKPIHDATRAEGVQEPLWYWTPSIAPSGLAYYDGDMFPVWKDSILVGGLQSHAVHRLDYHGGSVVGEERIDIGARVRDVRQGPEGAIYVLTDEESGRLLRIVPNQQERGSAY